MVRSRPVGACGSVRAVADGLASPCADTDAGRSALPLGLARGAGLGHYQLVLTAVMPEYRPATHIHMILMIIRIQFNTHLWREGSGGSTPLAVDIAYRYDYEAKRPQAHKVADTLNQFRDPGVLSLLANHTGGRSHSRLKKHILKS